MNTTRAQELWDRFVVLEIAYNFSGDPKTHEDMRRAHEGFIAEVARLRGKRFELTSSYAYRGVDPARLVEVSAR